MPKISVITPTVRIEGIKLVQDSLDRQTFTDYEWIIITPKPEELKGLPSSVVLLEDPPKEPGDYWTFNKAMNKAVKHAESPLIVNIQDYTGFNPDGLEKFWFYFKNGYERALIGGVGDKFDEKGQKVWADPRKRLDQGTFYECYPRDVEFNYCSVPTEAFYEVGGMDEWLDKYAGMDHISLQERLDTVGYKFYLDQTNETRSGVHGRLPNWEENLALNGPYEQRKQELILNGIYPILNYL